MLNGDIVSIRPFVSLFANEFLTTERISMKFDIRGPAQEVLERIWFLSVCPIQSHFTWTSYWTYRFSQKGTCREFGAW